MVFHNRLGLSVQSYNQISCRIPFTRQDKTLKSAFTILLTLLLTACTTTALMPARPDSPVTQQADAADEKQLPADAAAEPAAKQPDDDESADGAEEEEVGLPLIGLSSDLMYEILAADFAYQSGQWQQAFEAMMSLAGKTRDPRLARRAAEMAVKAQDIEKSLAATRLWHQLAPGSKEAERYYLAFLILGDELKEAQPLLSVLLKETPPELRGTMILQMQRLLSAAKNKPLAFSVLEEVLQPYSSLVESHIALSLLAYSNHDRARALEESNRALAVKPDSELAALAKAQAIADPAEATRSLAAFLSAYPKSRQVRIAYARMLVGQKQYDRARAEFEKLLASQPHDPVSLYSLGILSLQGNDAKRAEKYLTEYLDAASVQQREERELHQVLVLLAQIAEEQGDHATALKWLGQIEREPDDGRAYVRARIKSAQIMAKMGDMTGARNLLASTHAESPQEQELIILAESQLLRDAGQTKQSYSVLAAGLEQMPDNVNLLYDFALTAEKLDRMDVMERALRRILVLDPTNFHAYNALGYSLADRGLRLDEAYALIEKALRLAPGDPFILDSMGWVLYRQGRLGEAEERLRQAYKLRPDAEIAIHLGEVLWMSGQTYEAQQLWAEAGRKDPKNELLKSTLQRLKVQP